MKATNPVEILLVEDNPADVELTLRALKKHNLTNKVHVVNDGAKALDYLFGSGAFSGGKKAAATQGHLPGPETAPSGRPRGAAPPEE